MFDYLVAGAGFAGAVIAERLARCYGKKVLIVDRRDHVGGNAYDHYNGDGLLVHRYGPHIFHTNSQKVFQYLSQFTAWRHYEHRVLSYVDGKLVPIPINRETVNRLYNLNLISESDVQAFFDTLAEPRPLIRTSEDAVISKVGRDLYEKLFRNYTRKQWGKDPSELDAQVAARIPVRTNSDDRYFTDVYQAMPRDGYTRLFENMLDHKNITIQLGCDYRDIVAEITVKGLIYTGPIDEFFNYRYGKLPYRSLQFKHDTLDVEYFQPVAVINYPNDHAYTRITEFKHLTGQQHSKTSIVYEYPTAEGDPYYPVPTAENAELYKRYAQLASSTRGVYLAGRLGTYKYYNMDQVVAQALTLCKQFENPDLMPLTAAADPAPSRLGVALRPAMSPVARSIG
jgi:UDP-galactopyranose mutase